MVIFDLDLTIWECHDVHGNNIWAKQLVPPFQIEGHIVYDDVKSKCTLRKGVYSYIKWLNDNGEIIGYCSVGAYKNLPLKLQPSIILLKKFDLLKFFNGPSMLEYKDYDKTKFLVKINEKSTFYDDNESILQNASKLINIDAIDAKKILNWLLLID